MVASLGNWLGEWVFSGGGWSRLFLLLVLMVGLLPGCSVRQLAVNKAGDALASSGTTLASDEDPELIRDAVPFSLKLMESLLAESPRHRGLLYATAAAASSPNNGLRVRSPGCGPARRPRPGGCLGETPPRPRNVSPRPRLRVARSRRCASRIQPATSSGPEIRGAQCAQGRRAVAVLDGGFLGRVDLVSKGDPRRSPRCR